MSTVVSKHQNGESWTDPKRWLWLLSPSVPLFGTAAIYFAHIQAMPMLLWYMPFLVYFGIPILDAIVGNDKTNPPDEVVEQLESNKYYRYIVFAYLPAQYAITVLGAWVAVSGTLEWWGMLGLLLSVGVVNGIGINAAHELGHRTGDFERWLSKLALAPVLYGHFYVEHNRGHHKNVATPNDPASSRMGESFYRFLPRTLYGSLRSAWTLEKARLNRKNKSVWSIENNNLQAWLMTVILFGAITAWFGWAALPFLIMQGLFGACLLEVVNYIEHYGLLRDYNEKVSRYERCKPEHSWNSNNVVTNLFLYQLQRHSDHHANPSRRYQSLRHFEDSPQLPSGYATMILYAYVPFLWFRKMDPLVISHYNGDVRRANIEPTKRKQLYKRWPGSAFASR